MKTIFCLVTICFFIQGCVGIPKGTSLRSSEIVGERYSENGEIISFIERREINYHKYYMASPEGSGDFTLVDEHYYLFNNEKFKIIDHIKFKVDLDKGDSDFIDTFLPIGTNEWVAFHVINTERNSYDIEMVIFNHKEILHKKTIKGCLRTQCQHTKLNNYGIYPDKDNTSIIFKTNTGDYKFNSEDYSYNKI